MELPKNKTALAAGVALAGIVTTVALATAVWPALTRPDPPAEATGNDGLRIRLVEPPKAVVAKTSPLDVGLSEAAQAMAKGREALFVRTPGFRPAPAPAPAPPRYAPVQTARADEDDDLAPPPEPVDDRWERDHGESGVELAQQRWEEERQARSERERRAAWEQTQRDRRRWEEGREQDRYDDRRYDDRYAPPPPDDDRPPPRW
ncbi:hypothetical protein ASD21_08600 [Caulobacter sp. Root1455]|uniref:hypothetical protein n=1 Tax=Caulobacter sp. Root1455 TaxID=1736465 RepID=UPI0006F8854B|nr:hypothetical protein [Caulobacter sp. Root1455]KQY95395.1 hypothetical protein ASD21_08600 [Caulobacter sp. Root1455]